MADKLKIILNLDVFHNDVDTVVWTSEKWHGEMEGSPSKCDPLMLQKESFLDAGTYQLFRLQSVNDGVAEYRPAPIARVGWFYKSLSNFGFTKEG